MVERLLWLATTDEINLDKMPIDFVDDMEAAAAEIKRLHFDLGNMEIRCRHLLSCIDSCDEAGAPPCELDREDVILIDETRRALAETGGEA
jgi:hypothetical protein